jgi:hypothetical protein
MAMRCAIMQPTFCPWAGYFRLLESVDRFVFLDDVQLERQSWQTRNRVLQNGRVQWLIACIRHDSLEQTIEETRLAGDERWRRKLGSRLRHAYARHPHVRELQELIAMIESSPQENLAAFNIAIIRYCAERLGIATPTLRSSEMTLDTSQRTERLVEMCVQLGCDTYVSPIGSAAYLASDGFTRMADTRLEFFDAVPPCYPQRGSESFISHLSIIDVVANLGWEGAGAYVRAPWTIQEERT